MQSWCNLGYRNRNPIVLEQEAGHVFVQKKAPWIAQTLKPQSLIPLQSFRNPGYRNCSPIVVDQERVSIVLTTVTKNTDLDRLILIDIVEDSTQSLQFKYLVSNLTFVDLVQPMIYISNWFVVYLFLPSWSLTIGPQFWYLGLCKDCKGLWKH